MKTRDDKFGRVRAVHPYAWIWEPLENDPGFVLRSMFGSKAVYLDGKIVLGFMARGEEPWRGVLISTDATRHAALRSEFPSLAPHPVLPKWLYLPEADEAFERIAVKLVALVRRRDPRIGVVPPVKKKRRAAPRKRARGRAGL